jgi:HIV Tat-specific factor 1
MNGRFFAGRQVIATLYDGKQKFQRSGNDVEGEGDDEKKRLDAFASWLEKGGEQEDGDET